MSQVVNGVEHAAEHFPALVQMMQVGSGEMPAGIAIAGRIQRRVIVAVHRVADFTTPGSGNKLTFWALRGRMTQSNMLTPRRTASTRSSGLPTPIRYRGF